MTVMIDETEWLAWIVSHGYFSSDWSQNMAFPYQRFHSCRYFLNLEIIWYLWILIIEIYLGTDVNSPTSPEGYMGKPAQGQSLIHYLSTQDFHTCANLDKVSWNTKYNTLKQWIRWTVWPSFTFYIIMKYKHCMYLWNYSLEKV